MNGDVKAPIEGTEGTEGAEGTDGTQTDAGTQVDEAQSKPGEGAGADGGTETSEVGGADGELEEGTESQEGEETSQPSVEDRLSEALNKIEALEKKAGVTPEKEQGPQAWQPKELNMSEEEWSKAEEQHGMSRSSIRISYRQSQEINYLKSQLAGILKNTAMEQFGKRQGFADMGKYRQGMDEYLKRFDVSLHSNPELLETAYFYAKGKGTNAAVKKAVTTKERNLKVISRTKPSVSTGKGKPSKGLTESQKAYCRRCGVSEADYIREMNSGSTIHT